jgi:hypothetical protein
MPSFYCRVRVESADDTTIWGVSDGTFEIHSAIFNEGIFSPLIFNNLEPGTSRVITPEFPPAPHDTIGTETIQGDPNAEILVTFALPTTLQNLSGDTISISYNGTSAAVVDRISGAISFFDPRSGTRAYLDYIEGVTTIKIGGIVNVPINAKPDIYTGSYIITASYIACCNTAKNSKTANLINKISDEINIFATVIPSVAVDEHLTSTPIRFHLNEAFPNPFNPSTKIQFSLPHSSFVSLKIFNLLGEEVATLASEELPAGIYQRSWNASTFASGVYYYRIQTEQYSETKKLILLK